MVAFAQIGTDSQSIAHIQNTAPLPVARLGRVDVSAGERLHAVLTRGSSRPELYLELAGGRLDPTALLARLGANG